MARTVYERHYWTREETAKRFWARVDTTGDCWLWTLYTGPKGYGSWGVYEGETPRGTRRYMAHRLAWELTNGPIPEGLCVLHRCDNPPCCNPAHLFLGTKADNNRDTFQKGRQQKGEGHYLARLSADDVREIRARYRAGEGPLSIARSFGRHRQTIWDVVRYVTWKSVE